MPVVYEIRMKKRYGIFDMGTESSPLLRYIPAEFFQADLDSMAPGEKLVQEVKTWSAAVRLANELNR